MDNQKLTAILLLDLFVLYDTVCKSYNIIRSIDAGKLICSTYVGDGDFGSFCIQRRMP